MSNRKKVLILGCTGSIGTQAIDVCRRHPDKLEVVGLACGTRASDLLFQARDLEVGMLALGDESQSETVEAFELSELAASFKDGWFGIGSDAVLSLINRVDCDVVVNSLVGARGLRASYETLKSGKVLALANKESLVVGGDLIMPLARKLDGRYAVLGDEAEFRPKGALMPIDSEHGAIFQCLLGERMDEVQNLWVTASGGPFRGKKRSDLENVTASDALAHPTWNMGAKITIDSSTLMNKGLEVIEAHHLFGAPYEAIKVVVQPQSEIHSMVEFVDGSVKAHLGVTDMRIPIQFALSYPNRWSSPVKHMNFCALGSMDFAEPDTDTFRCLALAREAGRYGGTMPCAMNAANEVAVAAFLAGECGFLDIADTVASVMESHKTEVVSSIEQLVEVDERSRVEARQYLADMV